MFSSGQEKGLIDDDDEYNDLLCCGLGPLSESLWPARVIDLSKYII